MRLLCLGGNWLAKLIPINFITRGKNYRYLTLVVSLTCCFSEFVISLELIAQYSNVVENGFISLKDTRQKKSNIHELNMVFTQLSSNNIINHI